MKLYTLAACLVLSFTSLAQVQSPQPYCTAGTSTNGCTPSITASAQPNVANTAGCVILTTGVEGQKQGVFFYGVDNGGFTPLPWGVGSSSFLCAKPPTVRLGAPQNSGGVAGACNGAYVVLWDQFHLANPTSLGNPWVAGDKAFVQSWYRDPQAVKGSNLSNALELTLRDPLPVPCLTTIPGMVVIPAGSFQMGSNTPGGAPYFGDSTTQPVHSVTISYCFWMGATEVTQAQFTAIMGFNPAFFGTGSTSGNYPVESVGSGLADAYCALLTAQQSALGNVPAGYQYRLPTEAEWEYACRAGSTSQFNTGASLLCHQARFRWSHHSLTTCFFLGGPDPVASYAPNAWGLYDMHGNVAELCLDSLESYVAGPVTDPFVSSTNVRVVRGGGWDDESNRCRSSYRNSGGGNNVGFRVVLAPILVP